MWEIVESDSARKREEIEGKKENEEEEEEKVEYKF